jgi:hypothetical protein
MHVLRVIFLLLLVTITGRAQVVQTIRGSVVDKATRQPLPGASIVVKGSVPLLGAVSNEVGEFTILNVPIGRQSIQCTFVGYESFQSEEFILSSAKSVVVAIELQPGVMLEGIELKAARIVSEPINEHGVVSARSFSVEETERISASVNDMGRMALSFPGVQKGQNDTENDVIIRGNSSFGVLWRLEGIDIPNPNHFARPGTSGGGITVFSAQLLSRSDFFSGGMPAEYGNAISGAFDVHFKRGNLNDREYRTKVGLLGLDFATEGPIQKGRSSYVANYRYSTLGLLNKMGFHLVGERVSNEFQDFSFNLFSKSKDQKTHVTLFGLGGLSKEHYTPVADPLLRDPGVANEWEDKTNLSNMGTIGSTVMRTINSKSYVNGVIAFMGSDIGRHYDTLNKYDARFRYNEQRYLDQRISTAIAYNNKLNSQLSYKVGVIAHQIFYDFNRNTFSRNSVNDVGVQNLQVNVNGGGATQTLQFYGLQTYQPGSRLTINLGAHVMRLFLNKTFSVDPRASIRYAIGEKQHISLALGRHSQMLPLPAYFFVRKDTLLNGTIRDNKVNFQLPFIRALHTVFSYVVNLPGDYKITTEAYYQTLSNVPVATAAGTTYWMLNSQDDYPTFEVESGGVGRNKGIDLVVEKSFSKKFYFLATASLFDSKFKTMTSSYLNTRFNSRWSTTFTAGREFVLAAGKSLQVGGRILYNGGFRYSPYDPFRSAQTGRFVELAGQEWTGQVPAYFRIDARLAYRFNHPKYSGQVSLDIQNVTSKANVNSVGYDPVSNSTYFRKYDGVSFIPILAVQFDF